MPYILLISGLIVLFRNKRQALESTGLKKKNFF